ncbi:dihydrolipoyl dehydrogenase family protein [Paenibacillus kandeliae]|uniref:dihydrolipoyl dehydrogenase family protein n=1 Tax=Paenibacillus kandeliae TaxID=3231269 RepID=UPI00345A4080
MTSSFDLIVIGTGSAGASIAQACRKEGWNVAIVDEREYGGTCALRGCDPKKVLVGAAELVDHTALLKGKGIVDTARINWQDLMAFKHTFTDYIPGAHEQKLKDAGIHTLHGQAHFADDDVIEIDGKTFQAKHIVIATGAAPAPLDVDGEEHLADSDDFLSLETLPERIVFVGGGYISFEFAHIAARAGAEVHILHTSNRPLKGFDPDLVDELVERSREVGIHIHLNVSLQQIQSLGNDTDGNTSARYRLTAAYKREDGEIDEKRDPLELTCGLVVHGAGRAPNIQQLQLEQGNVNYSKKGIVVNDYLQSTSNPRVYAAGDCADSPGLPLTPLAGLEAKTVAHNLLNGNSQTTDYTEMPSVAFTIPRVAAVGLSEEEARKRGGSIKVNHMDMSSWYTYKRTNEQVASVKIILDTEQRTILGAHVLSGEADDLINHFAVAIRLKLTVDDLKKVTFAYPTVASDLGYMLDL